MRYNPIDTCYKKAIEDYGVIAKIDENQTKVLIRETSDNYGIDYKKIISSNPLQQGNYVYINGVQFLICDIEPQYSQSIYNIGIFRETLPILLGSTYKKVSAIVDKVKGMYVDGSLIEEVHDQYNFIIPKGGNNVGYNQVIYDGGVYKIISIDTSKDDIIIYTGKFESIYDPHVYTISLAENMTTIVEGATYQISNVICKDNGTVVTPTPTLTYISSDETIATVNSSGFVTGIKTGTCNINVVFNGVSAILSLTVNAKPVQPVISYSYTNSTGTTLKYMTANTFTCSKTINGVADTSFTGANISYTLDTTGQSLLSQSKIAITIGTTAPTLNLRNKQNTATYTIHITIKDSVNGTVIVDNLAITLTP